ncbi:MAG: conjugal transfer protein TrbF [Steroidobacteraceae bacterium]
MPFKRASVRYSKTPIPETPYQAAQQLWDERLGSARVQARSWRLMAFASLGLACVLAGGLLWYSGRSRITPYVVEVDRTGEVLGVGPATETYHPQDAQIAYFLSRFIEDVRSVPLDPVVLRQDWLEAYDYVTPRGAQMLNAYARANDPFAQVGRSSVAVQVTSIVRMSGSSFQVQWTEQTFANGALASTDRWTGILTIVIHTPHDVVSLRKNPLGIYIDGLDWSRELGTLQSTGDTQ